MCPFADTPSTLAQELAEEQAGGEADPAQRTPSSQGNLTQPLLWGSELPLLQPGNSPTSPQAVQGFNILPVSLINSAGIQLCSISSPSRQLWLHGALSWDAPALVLGTAQPRAHQASTRSSGREQGTLWRFNSPPWSPAKPGEGILLLHQPQLPAQSEPCCVFTGTRASLGQALPYS